MSAAPEAIEAQLVDLYEPLSGESSASALLEMLSLRRGEVHRKLWRTGGALFRGWNVTALDDCSAIADSIAPIPFPPIGGDSPRSKEHGRVWSASEAPAGKQVYLHVERSYSRSRPELVLFFCRRAPESGGECLIADGRRALDRLPTRTADIVQSQLFRYARNLPVAPTPSRKSWLDTFHVTSVQEMEAYAGRSGLSYRWLPDESIVVWEDVPGVTCHRRTNSKSICCPAPYWHTRRLPEAIRREILNARGREGFHQSSTYADGREIENSVLDDLIDAVSTSVSTLRWQTGDVLLIDNEILMHGRAPFVGSRLHSVALGADKEFDVP